MVGRPPRCGVARQQSSGRWAREDGRQPGVAQMAGVCAWNGDHSKNFIELPALAAPPLLFWRALPVQRRPAVNLCREGGAEGSGGHLLCSQVRNVGSVSQAAGTLLYNLQAGSSSNNITWQRQAPTSRAHHN